MKELSIIAQVVYAGHWMMMPVMEMTFQRPWVIGVEMRKGLDELVEAGYLSVEKFDNKYSDAMVWKPTQKMMDLDRSENWYERSFLEEHGRFKVIDESQKRDTN